MHGFRMSDENDIIPSPRDETKAQMEKERRDDEYKEQRETILEKQRKQEYPELAYRLRDDFTQLNVCDPRNEPLCESGAHWNPGESAELARQMKRMRDTPIKEHNVTSTRPFYLFDHSHTCSIEYTSLGCSLDVYNARCGAFAP